MDVLFMSLDCDILYLHLFHNTRDYTHTLLNLLYTQNKPKELAKVPPHGFLAQRFKWPGLSP